MIKLAVDDLHLSYGDNAILKGVSMQLSQGEVVSLLGPSGSGKTTLLRAVAGLEQPHRGTIRIEDRVVFDGAAKTEVPAEKRNLGLVFQSYALWPHRTVFDNVAYGLKLRKVPRAESRQRVDDALALVGLVGMAHRHPAQMSGGQQQRVALARAIVRQPRLFLLDEPLSNLDAKLRLETRVELRKLQRALGVTTVYVTHDQEEAMTIADRVAVFIEGRIVQVGKPQEIFAKPASTIVAGFIGNPPMNLLPAEVRAGSLRVGGVDLRLNRSLGADGPVTLGVRPAALRIAPTGLPARVYLLEELGDTTIIDLDVAGQIVKLRTDQPPHVREGDNVHVAFASCHLFERESGARRDE